MSASRPLIPRAGNAMRPVFILVAGFFGVMLIGYPIFMHVMGLSTTGIVWITLLILVVATGILGFILYLARAYDHDESSLDAGEVWAEWTVPAEQYRRFVAGERRSTHRRALAYALGGAALGIGLGALENDRLLAGIMIVAFLIASIVIVTLGGPPRSASSDEARRIRIGPRGVHVMGRYLAFDAPLTRLCGVGVEPGDPPTMRFRVQSGRRTEEIRVPVSPDRLQEAEDLAERFHREQDLGQF